MKTRCLCGLAVVLVALAGSAWGQAPERIGTVLLVEGVAEVRAEGATEWERLRFRDAVFVRDTVRTAAESKVKFLLRDDSILTLGERSELELTEFLLREGQRRSILSLLVGTVRVLTTRLFGVGSELEVRTPNSVVGVRGTAFIVRFVPPDTTEVIVLEGEVTVRHLEAAIPGEEAVQANFRSRVRGAAPPERPEPVTPDERAQLEQAVQAIEQVPEEVLPTEALEPAGVPRGAEALPGPQTEAPLETATTRPEAPPEPPAPAVPEVERLANPETGLQSEITPDTSPAAEEVISRSRLTVNVTFPR
ncbi:MAG: hypothetical protein KatS3mg131_2272 [Candidatus Tectimicrobiota bacterium]|nr:MAG: hypothetical protein KatS3mg131_2272 [Candidatus Tectomicrobia bacterium]